MTEPQATAIRPLSRDDRAAWQRLWEGYLAFYETNLARAVIETAFERLLSGARGEFAGLIAEVDGQPAGLAHYLFHRHGWRIENVCYLQDLYAEPEVRGTGVGRALIEAVYAARRRGGRAGGLLADAGVQQPARRLYDRIGRTTPFIKYDRA